MKKSGEVPDFGDCSPDKWIQALLFAVHLQSNYVL